jgi:hypothetical protein
LILGEDSKIVVYTETSTTPPEIARTKQSERGIAPSSIMCARPFHSVKLHVHKLTVSTHIYRYVDKTRQIERERERERERPSRAEWKRASSGIGEIAYESRERERTSAGA